MDASKYVGKPWVAGASGPDTFDCWGVVRHWYQAKFGQTLPDFKSHTIDFIDLARKFRYEEKGSDWLELHHPVTDCIVALGKGKQVTHCGVYIGDNLVLHSSQESKRCVIQSLDQLHRQWGTIKFYVPSDNNC
jgi:cell wall-associated NlpC family hydrolase